MNDVFPFGFPLPTACYLTLYVLTFALHQAFMHYVLAGSLYVAWATWFPAREETPRCQQPLAQILSDWMPFMLSAAITAGVAPLLFVQIVYPQHFYTANVLLSWRWMIVIPVLIAAFYLLYVIKSSLLRQAMSVLAPGIVAACFLFVGFCWTANYYVTANQGQWGELYLNGTLPFETRQVLLRMTIWLAGSFPTMASIVAWQLSGKKTKGEDEADENAFRQLALMSIAGLCVAAVAVYLIVSSDVEWEPARTLCFPYLLIAAIGGILQIIYWAARFRSIATNRIWLTIATLVMAVTISCVAVVRESIRLTKLNLDELYAHHAESWEIGGLGLFLVFSLVNGGLIALCVWIVRSR